MHTFDLRLPSRPVLLAIALLAALSCELASAADTAAARGKRIPVILDTDIGDDIDDTWALGLLLSCPELDLKLVVGDYGRPHYRARLLAKLLQELGRADIPIGMGVAVPGVGGVESQARWWATMTSSRTPARSIPTACRRWWTPSCSHPSRSP